AHAAREHDRLVVTADLSAHAGTSGSRTIDLKRPEVAGDGGAPELVVEGGAAQRPVGHDVERAGDAVGLAMVALPGAHGAGQAQVRHREAREARLRLATPARRALVADLAARPRGGAWEGRDGRGVVVRLDLHEDVNRLVVRAVDARRRVGE